MERDVGEDLRACFSGLKDPRVERTRRHQLTDVVMIAICAVICSAESWIDIERWGKMKESLLREFLVLPNGIPSHDTFARVFSRLDPLGFQSCFARWLSLLGIKPEEGEVIAIDGKTMRRSYDRAVSQSPLHLVSAWASSCGVSLGQVAVDGKSNEITAIPQLLALLELRGCVVTLDAMGCQRSIADAITEKKADYLLALKANHGDFHDDVTTFFKAEKEDNFKECSHTYYESVDKEHGRVEVRRCWSTDNIAWLGREEDWAGLKSISMVESERTVLSPVAGEEKTTIEHRFYISSLPAVAEKIAKAVRAHWSIENSLHWSLDVTFDEDRSRIRKDRAPENFAILRKIALSLLKKTPDSWNSTRGKRKMAGWDERFFVKVLFGQQI